MPRQAKPTLQASREFKVPAALLKSFEAEVRFIPKELHPNGYIVFDRAMLKKILLSEDLQARQELAGQLDRLDKAGGQLVIVGP